MFDKTYLLPADALQRLLSSIPDTLITTERLKIEECYNRIISVDVVAPEDLPAFSRSTVDGYALNARDTFGAKDTSPAYITVRNEIMMGTSPDFEIKTGEAAKIPTGGMMPKGADAVLMLEHAQAVSDDMIEAMRSVAPGENVIQKGEDIQKGATVLASGRRLRPQDIGALAGIGITGIEVFKKPVVSIISTGDEIVPASSLLKLGQVRDINSFTLAGLISDNGGVPVKKGIFKDDYGTIKKAIEDSVKDSDMVLISGGTSAGTKDMTADIINDIAMSQGGAGVVFHGLSLKPGKPMIGGVVNNKPILGLPGHPAAVVVCFNLFIKPALERLGGFISNKIFIKTVAAKMAKNIASAAGREDHIRVYLEEKDGEFSAVPVLGKSGLITTLVKADGIVVIPQNKLGLDAGEDVTVRLF
ncbi:MAG TPA: molybdopterin molybdenumtransferase MoeA [Nitrospiraceae bacterium]|nr:MAG: molybdopterin molybdenumtransferase MoeA [Nitrospirae bacterium GWA2_46_11]OGW23185.1 MAG: molybdopterin molybdenumtransferase MoeA [Nitrospirae bacterium GWB2_47_37]HAK87735.1 molybdopterin molybdenumtransferase MoeA [Nitrospiraceae bacterium]HCZ11447.1 molybdopterin molybdenumtransferase MoeA [Nitrospiraceae bacterium]